MGNDILWRPIWWGINFYLDVPLLLSYLGDKVPANVKAPVEEAIEKLKKDIERDDTEAMKADSKALEEKLMEIGQAVYQQQQQAGGAAGAQPGAGASAQQGKNDDGVVDAEVVDD